MIINYKMKFMLIVCVIIALSIEVCESKGGSRGSSSRGSSSRGSSSRGSSSGGGYFGGGSKSSSSSGSSGGWFGGGGSKSSGSSSSSGGWFGGGSKSSGSSGSSGGWFGGGSRSSSTRQRNTNYYSHNNYNSYSSPSYSNQYGGRYFSSYGGGNTYVNNYYGGRRASSGSSFLTYGLFYGAGMHHGHSMGRSSSYRRWDDEEDRRWRATTKAPYFENKQPGSESVLPAAAVLGAAAAFGMYSLLPLNVPNGKPILSCNATDIQQTQINFNGFTYGCLNNIISVSCFKVDPITNGTIDICPGKTLECDKTSDIPNMSCTNGTLLSSEAIFCNSTTILNGINVNDNTQILNCYSGVLPMNMVGSVPTQAPEPEEKPLSIGAHVHTFLLWTMGKSEILETKLPTTTPAPQTFVPKFFSQNDTIAFIPTISNETTTNATSTYLNDILKESSDLPTMTTESTDIDYLLSITDY